MGDLLNRFLYAVLLVVTLLIAIYLFIMLIATAGYSTYSERALLLDFIGITLTSLFIRIGLDTASEALLHRRSENRRTF